MQKHTKMTDMHHGRLGTILRSCCCTLAVFVAISLCVGKALAATATENIVNRHIKISEGETMKRLIAGLMVVAMAEAVSASTVAYWPLTQTNNVRTTTETVFANEGDNSAMERAAKAREKAGALRELLKEIER